MVEIALCLAILAFAMVAIMGVLPTGLRVQRENREETIINQDGNFLLEAIRAGSRGVDDLTNYVDSITISNLTTRTRATFVRGTGANNLNTGAKIIGLLSTPKLSVEYSGGPLVYTATRTNTNIVTARVRALNGAAAEKTPSTNDDDLTFTYLVTSEIVPTAPGFLREQVEYNAAILTPDQQLARSNLWQKLRSYQANVHELRLTLQYPLIVGVNNTIVGNNQKSFRTLLGGRLVSTNDPDLRWPLYFFAPSTFVQLTNVLTPRF
ncbi:MAG: hypothetical protein HYY24_03980 [Verrucomicrobia bacterium]|nr:hypothetical protein [Verrucomicrobiota bacterium]